MEQNEVLKFESQHQFLNKLNDIEKEVSNINNAVLNLSVGEEVKGCVDETWMIFIGTPFGTISISRVLDEVSREVNYKFVAAQELTQLLGLTTKSLKSWDLTYLLGSNKTDESITQYQPNIGIRLRNELDAYDRLRKGS